MIFPLPLTVAAARAPALRMSSSMDHIEGVKENFRPLKSGRADVGVRRGLASRDAALPQESAALWEERIVSAAGGADPLEPWKS